MPRPGHRSRCRMRRDGGGQLHLLFRPSGAVSLDTFPFRGGSLQSPPATNVTALPGLYGRLINNRSAACARCRPVSCWDRHRSRCWKRPAAERASAPVAPGTGCALGEGLVRFVDAKTCRKPLLNSQNTPQKPAVRPLAGHQIAHIIFIMCHLLWLHHTLLLWLHHKLL